VFGRRCIDNVRLGLLVILGFGLVVGWAGRSWAKDALALPPGLTALSQPMPMPSFDLPSIDGTTVASASLRGKVAVVRFWATW
jgi:hypothetical protein